MAGAAQALAHAGHIGPATIVTTTSLATTRLASVTARHAADIANLARIKAIDATSFPEQDLISHDLFERQLQQRIEDYDLKEYEMPLGGSGGRAEASTPRSPTCHSPCPSTP